MLDLIEIKSWCRFSWELAGAYPVNWKGRGPSSPVSICAGGLFRAWGQGDLDHGEGTALGPRLAGLQQVSRE